MAQKYIKLSGGRLVEQEALVQSAGAGDAGKIPGLDGGGRIDTSMMPVGIGAETKIAPASENLAAGDWVNFWLDGATLKVRKADATTAGKEADGFVLASVSSGQNATVYTDGVNNQMSGLNAGSVYYLSTTAGAETTSAPSATGNVVQPLGKAVSATEIVFHPQLAVTVA